MERTNGIHIIADFYDCQCSPQYLFDKNIALTFIEHFIKKSGLTIIKSDFHSFGADCGYTGYVLFAESHFSIHTWPKNQFTETNFINMDIFVCNYLKDNTDKAEFIFTNMHKMFDPTSSSQHRIFR